MNSIILNLILVAALLYGGLAAAVWKWRNPKANDTTTITHFSDMIQFRKLDKFQ